MTAADRAARITRLAAAAVARRSDAESRARRTIIRLQNADAPITFVAVARAASVSTSFLYQHPELRSAIEKHRTLVPARRRPDRETASAASLRAKLGVALHRNRELAEEVTALRAENQACAAVCLSSAAQTLHARPARSPSWQRHQSAVMRTPARARVGSARFGSGRDGAVQRNGSSVVAPRTETRRSTRADLTGTKPAEFRSHIRHSNSGSSHRNRAVLCNQRSHTAPKGRLGHRRLFVEW
ncbi:DUF6262 family protein [Mycobacteroides chelonae]|uniref:DUF6262 family protein n=1 Tax=Mycobacteroides chelonae TaxID=1774 RepID=UPI001F40C3ED|nr:DUF6262 family protein [Mycobacteroides chelonae]